MSNPFIDDWNVIVDFGKYKGKMILDLPKDYRI